MKSVDQISASVMKKIQSVLLHEMPEPSCPVAKQRWRWQVEQVKKRVSTQLWPENSGVSIDIKP